MIQQSNQPKLDAIYMEWTNKRKKVVTFVGDGVLHLWAFVTLVGVVTFAGATKVCIIVCSWEKSFIHDGSGQCQCLVIIYFRIGLAKSTTIRYKDVIRNLLPLARNGTMWDEETWTSYFSYFVKGKTVFLLSKLAVISKLLYLILELQRTFLFEM